MIIIEIHYSSLNFKVPLPHKLVSWRLNVRTWPLALGAFYRILTMERKWQEPPGGGEGQTYDLSLNFKTCRFGYWGGSHVSVGIILSWLCSGTSKPSDRGGGGHPDPDIRGGGRSFSFSFNPSFSLVPRSPTFQCKTEWDLGTRLPIFLLLAAISPVLCRFLKATLLVRILP